MAHGQLVQNHAVLESKGGKEPLHKSLSMVVDLVALTEPVTHGFVIDSPVVQVNKNSL